MNKKLMVSSLLKQNELDLRYDAVEKITQLLSDMQLDHEQKEGKLDKGAHLTFFENSLQILAMTCVYFIGNLPLDLESKREITKEINENIMENVIFNCKKNNE